MVPNLVSSAEKIKGFLSAGKTFLVKVKLHNKVIHF